MGRAPPGRWPPPQSHPQTFALFTECISRFCVHLCTRLPVFACGFVSPRDILKADAFAFKSTMDYSKILKQYLAKALIFYASSKTEHY